uniref:Transglycosylase SLT domain-containing protein n=1 Tax=Serratia phage Kevin TaxID=3161161 RepID=A0AAU8KWW0_9CAUD
MTMSKLKAMSAMVFTLASGTATASLSTQCNIEFTDHQLATMSRAWNTGAKSDLGYTLAAISWKESRAGEDVVRYKGSLKNANLGAFQNKVSSAGTREGCKSRKCYADVAYKLITDQKFASEHALLEMNFWMGVHNNNVRRALASYNSGHAHNSQSRSYAQSVLVKTKYLKKCVSFNGRPVANKPEPSVLASNQRTLSKLKRIR